jgi:hypothetical protein
VASGKCSPLTVAGAAVDLYRRASALDAYHIPSSLSHLREAINGGSTPLRSYIVNGDESAGDARAPGGWFTVAAPTTHGRRTTIVVGAVMDYAESVVRCFSPTMGWRVKREAGASAQVGAQFRHCPRNGKRVKTNT